MPIPIAAPIRPRISAGRASWRARWAAASAGSRPSRRPDLEPQRREGDQGQQQAADDQEGAAVVGAEQAGTRTVTRAPPKTKPTLAVAASRAPPASERGGCCGAGPSSRTLPGREGPHSPADPGEDVIRSKRCITSSILSRAHRARVPPPRAGSPRRARDGRRRHHDSLASRYTGSRTHGRSRRSPAFPATAPRTRKSGRYRTPGPRRRPRRPGRRTRPGRVGTAAPGSRNRRRRVRPRARPPGAPPRRPNSAELDDYPEHPRRALGAAIARRRFLRGRFALPRSKHDRALVRQPTVAAASAGATASAGARQAGLTPQGTRAEPLALGPCALQGVQQVPRVGGQQLGPCVTRATRRRAPLPAISTSEPQAVARCGRIPARSHRYPQGTTWWEWARSGSSRRHSRLAGPAPASQAPRRREDEARGRGVHGHPRDRLAGFAGGQMQRVHRGGPRR